LHYNISQFPIWTTFEDTGAMHCIYALLYVKKAWLLQTYYRTSNAL